MDAARDAGRPGAGPPCVVTVLRIRRAAVDPVIASACDGAVLGVGKPQILLHNRLFQRLVEAHESHARVGE